MEDLKNRVKDHDHAIDKLTIAVESLATTSKESNSKLSDIAKSMGKQEVILERINNIDTKATATASRIHKRMDDIETNLADKHLLMMKPLQDDVLQLKADRTWLTRVVIGKVVLLVLGMIFYIKG